MIGLSMLHCKLVKQKAFNLPKPVVIGLLTTYPGNIRSKASYKRFELNLPVPK